MKEKKNYAPALLLRGRIYFARGEKKTAQRDFHAATGSPENKERLEAWLWLSRTYRTLFNNYLQAERACRSGLSIDGNDLPLLFERVLISFAYGGVDDPQAEEYLTRVIEIDPTHGNAYSIWRDSLIFHPAYDTGRVSRGVKRYLAVNPDSTRWAVEIAWFDFLAGSADSALALLERLKAVQPDYDSADRELLLARCALETGDSLGFQEYYARALDIAVERDENTRAFPETEVILTKQAAPRWGECKSNREKAAFLRWYWIDLDDDPIEPLNRRLIEHYNRYATRSTFLLRNPHSSLTSLKNYNRLVIPNPWSTTTIRAVRRQSEILRLDPRGVVWVRFGPPEKREKHL